MRFCGSSLIYLVFLAGCAPYLGTPKSSDLDRTVPKNIILVLGDGMGPQQLGLLFLYAKKAPHSIFKTSLATSYKTRTEQFIKQCALGIVTTEPANNLVVDSACSITQLTSGKSCNPESVGVNAEGDPVETILERAKKRGKLTGLVSDTRITHATPAGLASHVQHRSMESEIASQLIKNNVDVMLSAGTEYFLPQSASKVGSADYTWASTQFGAFFKPTSKREDDRNILKEAEAAGYALVFSKEQLFSSRTVPLLGLFAPGKMRNGISESSNDPRFVHEPSLAEMTDSALKLLSNPEQESSATKGFFLLVEGGQIDWAAHENDAGLLLHEMLKFEKMMNVIDTFSQTHPDTLVLVTADHETGSFGFSYSASDVEIHKTLDQDRYDFGELSVLDTLFFQKKSLRDLAQNFEKLPARQKTPAVLAQSIIDVTGFNFSIETAARLLKTYTHYLSHSRRDVFEYFHPNSEQLLTALIARELSLYQHVVWGTGTHTSTPVLLFAHGPSQYIKPFASILHATEVGDLLLRSF